MISPCRAHHVDPEWCARIRNSILLPRHNDRSVPVGGFSRHHRLSTFRCLSRSLFFFLLGNRLIESKHLFQLTLIFALFYTCTPVFLVRLSQQTDTKRKDLSDDEFFCFEFAHFRKLYRIVCCLCYFFEITLRSFGAYALLSSSSLQIFFFIVCISFSFLAIIFF